MHVTFIPHSHANQSCSRSENGCDATNGCNSASCMTDRQFIKDLIATLMSDLCIDRRHVHLTGMSAGAMMAYQVAMDLAPEIASIVPVSGVPFFGFNNLPSSPISVIILGWWVIASKLDVRIRAWVVSRDGIMFGRTAKFCFRCKEGYALSLPQYFILTPLFALPPSTHQ